MKNIVDKAIMLMFLVMADFMFTYIGIKGGFYEEANPLMKWLFELDLLSSLLFKLLYTSALLFIIYSINKEHDLGKYPQIAFQITVLSYLAVNVYHFYAWYTIIA